MNDTNGLHDHAQAPPGRGGADADHGHGAAAPAEGLSRALLARQFMVVLASVDAAGAAWASILFGKPGFVRLAEGGAIQVDVVEKERDAGDPLWDNLALERAVGLLLVEADSGRRYRIDGSVRRLDTRGVEVAIRAAAPLRPVALPCRRLRQLGDTRLPVQAAHGKVLRGGVGDMVRQADSVFIASRHGEAGARLAHRAGAPGLVDLVDDTTLHLPAYPGAALPQAHGAAQDAPRIGLCIHDVAHGQLLQLTGTARPLPRRDASGVHGLDERRWEFRVERWILRDTPQSMEWECLEAASAAAFGQD